MTIMCQMLLTPVECDDLRRLADRLRDRNGKPLDAVRRSVLAKLAKAANAADAQAKKSLWGTSRPETTVPVGTPIKAQAGF